VKTIAITSRVKNGVVLGLAIDDAGLSVAVRGGGSNRSIISVIQKQTIGRVDKTVGVDGIGKKNVVVRRSTE